MYDLGYGLGKMMEGASAGAVKGTMVNMARDERQKERTATEDYRNKSLGMQQQRIDNEEARIKIQQHASAFKAAYDIAKGSPDPQAVFLSVYKNLDPEGEAPEISFGETDMEIKYPTFEIAGSKEHLRQALEIISKNPGITPEVLLKLHELGLARITIPKSEKAKEYQPQLFTGPGGATRWVKPGDPVPEGFTKSSDSETGRSDFERAYQQYVGIPENATKTRADFRNNVWSKKSPAGELSDNSVLQNIRELASYDANKTSMMWDQYLVYRKEGLNRAEALNKVQKELSGDSGDAAKPLDAETAKQILKEAGGDKAKAREIAKQKGFKF